MAQAVAAEACVKNQEHLTPGLKTCVTCVACSFMPCNTELLSTFLVVSGEFLAHKLFVAYTWFTSGIFPHYYGVKPRF